VVRIDRKRVGQVDVLSFVGEFDRAPLVELDALVEEGRIRLVCSFRGLTFVTSPVIGHLVKTAKQLKTRGGEIVFSDPSRFMQATIQTLGLDQIFEVFPTDALAIRHLERARPAEGLPVDEKILGSTALFFRLADTPDTAVGRILALHEDGVAFQYPADPDRVKIDPEDLGAGCSLQIRFRQPFLDRERFFEMEAEIAESRGFDGESRRYRVRYTRIDDRDRTTLARLVRGPDRDAPAAP
jgi:anti-anti-sigma factor